MTVTFTCHTPIAAPPAAVFAAASSIDTHLASMAASGERAVGGVTSGRIGIGEEVTWRARHFGITWTMTSRITELDEPARFVDEQVRGPFRRFVHEHRVTATGAGTLMADEVRFTAPFGPVGRVAEKLLLGRYLARLIRQRNAFLKAQLEAG